MKLMQPKFAVPILLAAIGIGCSSGSSKTTRVDTDDPNKRLTSRDLDIQDFKETSTRLTNQMLSAPRLQRELAVPADPRAPLPLIKISRIKNDTGLKINMIDYLVTPMEEVFVNSGKVDFVSEDEIGKEIAAGQEVLGRGGVPRLPDYVLHGTVSKLATADAGTHQNAYVFQIRLTRTNDNAVVFVGSKDIAKQYNK